MTKTPSLPAGSIAIGTLTGDALVRVPADATVADVALMRRVVGELNPALAGFEASCFDGHYITGDVSQADFDAMREQRASQGDEEDAANRTRLALQNADTSAG